jgi:ADP-ribose pyrophosphatase
MKTFRSGKPALSRADVEVIEKTTPFQGYFRVDRYTFRHRLFGGGWSGAMTREVFERGHAVAVLPYDPIRDEVVLIEQFRAGAYAAERGPWLVEIVAGIVEDGEAHEDVARREAKEEAGLDMGALAFVCDYIASPGAMTHSVKVYVGQVDAEGTGGVFGVPEEHEDIRVEAVPFDEAMTLMRIGRIQDAAGIIALQWMALHRDALRGTWGAP